MNLYSLAKDISEHFSRSDLVEKVESIKSIEGEGIYSMIKIVLRLPYKDSVEISQRLSDEFPSLDFLDLQFSRDNGAFALMYYEK